MDRRERINSPLAAVRAALRGHEAGVWTALPAIVQSYDAAKVTVSAQPAIQAQVRTPGGAWNNATLPLCVDCPVQFPGGGGFVLTFPIAAGDEGLLVFASRCIDAWWQSGKVSPQAELRMHDLSDGFFFPQVFSNPRAPSGMSTTAAQLRSLDGLSYLELAAGHVVDVVAPGGLNITVGAGNTVTVSNLPAAAAGLPSGGLWRNGTQVMVVP